MDGKKIDLETFAETVNKELINNEIVLQIRMPEGTNEPEVESNVGIATIDLFIVMAGMAKCIDKVVDDAGGREKVKDYEKLIDGILKIIKDELMESEE